ncbi:DUF551 domain-containing protein [Escherichia coli]|uniref:DUF551 domain-containing protein n=1 Tax=Escherichia coli TaxID=562 RepID=UPI0015593083|nr:DUF551 domain-containing protein [Escherichia coli]
MTTFTKEQLIEIIKRNITVMDRYPDVVTAQMDLEVYKIALASLEAEPVAYIFKHPAGKLFWALADESNKDQADVIPVYAAAPASVVPDNASEPLAYAYKELTPEIMRNHLAVFERYGIAPNDSSTTIQALRIALDGIERSDAMLHGAEPVSQTYRLPPLSSSEVNDAAWKLHNMLTEHGPLNGRQFNNLKGCFYEALKVAMRNYPVTPDGWISCSERMPNDAQWCVVNTEYGYYVQCWSEGQGWLGDDISIPECDVINWMPLPEPPQEAK